MGLLKKLNDRVRTLIGIRKVRQLPVPRGKPALGTSIVLDNLRIRLLHPIDESFWQWLSSKGWRAMALNVHKNQRRYRLVPEKVLVQMILAPPAERERIHGQLTQHKV
ncbi:MAG: hypothetical protein Q8R67_13195 [Rhodoferax sp.]|nr:hypothetical protein [Rhodoferax sp.]MDP3652630.1 hypothetical protein [Rhodoferax sp.]